MMDIFGSYNNKVQLVSESEAFKSMSVDEKVDTLIADAKAINRRVFPYEHLSDAQYKEQQIYICCTINKKATTKDECVEAIKKLQEIYAGTGTKDAEIISGILSSGCMYKSGFDIREVVKNLFIKSEAKPEETRTLLLGCSTAKPEAEASKKQEEKKPKKADSEMKDTKKAAEAVQKATVEKVEEALDTQEAVAAAKDARTTASDIVRNCNQHAKAEKITNSQVEAISKVSNKVMQTSMEKKANFIKSKIAFTVKGIEATEMELNALVAMLKGSYLKKKLKEFQAVENAKLIQTTKVDLGNDFNYAFYVDSEISGKSVLVLFNTKPVQTAAGPGNNLAVELVDTAEVK